MARGSVARSEDLFAFFHDSVEAAVERRGKPVSEGSVFYLTTLLVDRGRIRPEDARADGPTLAELHLNAMSGGPARAVAAYREIGDRTLYTTGFFRRSLARRLVSVDYYRQMGAAAYQRLASLLRIPGAAGGLDDVFGELGRQFTLCSDLLQEVRDDLRAEEVSSEAEILRLYEEWLETGSARVAARLRELGVIPMRGDPPAWGGGLGGDDLDPA